VILFKPSKELKKSINFIEWMSKKKMLTNQ
jgi:hypothetical protein